jgi:hypothetical protein
LSVDLFNREFGRALARYLEADRGIFQGKLPADELAANRIKFASREWNEKR